ncbi:MAG: hypothetical protein A3G22_01100 [Alphaproteobacteria bacterium RIFCSPLOWO2_12_FULL_40_11]|nr:MAG: hypothetical protein A3G22_01100 [Alphaproteobacteria bacterium RIFCSPLOWO2_12_FULL_40_11]
MKILKRFLQLVGYSVLLFAFITGFVFMMLDNEFSIYLGLVLCAISLTFFSIIIWRKRKKLCDIEVVNPFKSENLNKWPDTLLKKVFLFLILLICTPIAVFSLFLAFRFVLENKYVAISLITLIPVIIQKGSQKLSKCVENMKKQSTCGSETNIPLVLKIFLFFAIAVDVIFLPIIRFDALFVVIFVVPTVFLILSIFAVQRRRKKSCITVPLINKNN